MYGELDPTHKRILLLGAGFSRNWGGWLANEAFEYLIGHDALTPELRNVLWTHRRRYGFEGALGEVQDEYFRSPSKAGRQRLKLFEQAVAQMFADMNSGFAASPFEFQAERRYSVTSFLEEFDAIFTLNQDLLLEQHYRNDVRKFGDSGRIWHGWQVFGARRDPGPDAGKVTARSDCSGIWVTSAVPLEPGMQPYVKLHGSSNWRATNDTTVMVIGTNKRARLDNFFQLQAGHRLFRESLCASDVRLVVIGYSFSDATSTRLLRARWISSSICSSSIRWA